MHLTELDFFFWFLTFVEHLVLLIILIRIHRFPGFTCLIALAVVRTVALYVLRSYGPAGSYFYAYWSMAVLDVGLQLLTAYELTLGVFRPTGFWELGIRRSVLLWACLSVGGAAALSLIPRPSSQFWLQTVILKGSFFSAAVMSELFIGMLVLSSRSKLTWSDQAANIVKGFTLYSLATLVIETVNTVYGLGDDGPLYNTLSQIRIVVYIGCAGYWIVSLLPGTFRGRKMPDRMQQQASAVAGAIGSRLETMKSEDPSE